VTPLVRTGVTGTRSLAHPPLTMHPTSRRLLNILVPVKRWVKYTTATYDAHGLQPGQSTMPSRSA
jgi:hypothetical protein